MYRTGRRRRRAIGLHAEPVTIDMPCMGIVGRAHQGPDDYRVAHEGFEDGRRGVAVHPAAEYLRRIIPPQDERLRAKIQRASAGPRDSNGRVLVLDEHDHLAEAADDVSGDDGLGANVHDGSAPDLLSGEGVVVCGIGRLRYERAKEAVLPSAYGVHMVMEIGGAELDVGIPAVSNELRADDLSAGVIELQGGLEVQGVAADLANPLHLEGRVLVHADADQRASLKSVGGGQCYRAVAGRGACRQTFSFHSEGPDGLLVVESRRNAVACLDIELDEVDVDVHLAEPVAVVPVFQLALQRDVGAVLARIAPYGEGDAQVVIGSNPLLILLQHENLALLVDKIELLVIQYWRGDDLYVELLRSCAAGAQAPRTVFSRRRKFVAVANRLEVWRRAVIWGKGRPLPKVRAQKGVGQLSGVGIEIQGRPLAGRLRCVARPLHKALDLVEVETALAPPVHDRGVIALGHAGGRKLSLDPRLQIPRGYIEGPAPPVNLGIHQRLRRDGGL